VLLPNSFGTAAAAWRAGVGERWGYATDGRGPLLTRRARVPAGVRGHSEVYYYRAMLAGVGLEVSAAPDTSLACPPEWAERARALLGEGDLIGLAAGAAFGGAKRWVGERFACVGDALARETGASVVFVGGPGEREAALELAGRMSCRPRVLCGETGLAELVGVLSRLRLLVCNDSGPMHLAAALGTPVAAVFGPTDWRETAPRGARARVLRAEGVPCAPCKLRECPIDHACMRGVDAATVARAAAGLLA
jgi:heptosyltransferase II